MRGDDWSIYQGHLNSGSSFKEDAFMLTFDLIKLGVYTVAFSSFKWPQQVMELS